MAIARALMLEQQWMAAASPCSGLRLNRAELKQQRLAAALASKKERPAKTVVCASPSNRGGVAESSGRDSQKASAQSTQRSLYKVVSSETSTRLRRRLASTTADTQEGDIPAEGTPLAQSRVLTQITQLPVPLSTRVPKTLDSQTGTVDTVSRSANAEFLKQQFEERRKRSRLRIKKQFHSEQGQEDAEVDFKADNSISAQHLIPGQYIVHKKYGVCKFIQLAVDKDGVEKVVLQFADGNAKLPAKTVSRHLYRYRSGGIDHGKAPALNKLHNTKAWETQKQKGTQQIQRIVNTAMELYVHRLQQTRTPYPTPGPMHKEFAAAFPHELTPDQQQAVLDVEEDMTKRLAPMDRLICADVGFGKTEVAMRAIFHAALAGKQVMVLAPTTVLAKQHYKTIRQRMEPYPELTVGSLSRFSTQADRQRIYAGMTDGSLRILVGTHAVLGDKVVPKDLGLVVIDEEQRFGVKQKEKLTAMKAQIDVLTLTATPIPRTLHMSMTGFRDVSVILTAPPQRKAIETFIGPYNEAQVVKTVNAELKRGGQTFYILPRIGNEEDEGQKGVISKAAELRKLFPKARIAMAYGKMKPTQLEYIMEEFVEGLHDILLCTSIVESGIDIVSANTVIVEDIHMFGLSQLYQLRGRVGRSDVQAHALMFYPQNARLSNEAKERLQALQDCTDLGQGFQLAQRDLMIRGTGNVFGEKQSGYVEKIGEDLYLEFLYDAIDKVDKQALPLVVMNDVRITLPLPRDVPAECVPRGEVERFRDTLQMAAIDGIEALSAAVATEYVRLGLHNKAGKVPKPLQDYVIRLTLMRLASNLGIHAIHGKSPGVYILETSMRDVAWDLLYESLTRPMKDVVEYKPGKLNLTFAGHADRDNYRLLVEFLAELHSGLPSFVKYI